MSIQKTYTPKPQDIQQGWWIVDAEGQTLGRLASKIAPILRGKHKPIYTPNADTGDYVIVLNVDKIAVTGNAMDDKIYYHHSHRRNGIKSISLRRNLERFPDRPLREAVKGMLPKNSLGRNMIKKLKLYAGTEHPHAAQQPQPLDLA